MLIENRYCLIMAGGIGSRFWPVSTSKFPKQFQDILGVGSTLIQQTYNRIRKIIPPENIFVVTSGQHVDIVSQQLPELNPMNIVGEPVMKNTAACNIYMAMKIKDLNPNAVICVLPADHLILKEDVFLSTLDLAYREADENNNLVTIGIQPMRPETGYGYIQFIEEKDKKIFKVKTFTEKPILEVARTFIESGDFLWNAGIFVWKIDDILEAFEQNLPDMYIHFLECRYNCPNEKSDIEVIYPKVQKISIDNGILEKTENVSVIPADLGWSDLGTWTSVFENAEKNEFENAENSRYIRSYNTSGSIIHIKNRNKVVVVDGLKDFIVVDTDKALLICPRDHDQDIKNYVTDIKTMKRGDRFI